jgi:hypothetical protein
MGGILPTEWSAKGINVHSISTKRIEGRYSELDGRNIPTAVDRDTAMPGFERVEDISYRGTVVVLFL